MLVLLVWCEDSTGFCDVDVAWFVRLCLSATEVLWICFGSHIPVV